MMRGDTRIRKRLNKYMKRGFRISIDGTDDCLVFCPDYLLLPDGSISTAQRAL
jgi:hypothetical protein